MLAVALVVAATACGGRSTVSGSASETAVTFSVTGEAPGGVTLTYGVAGNYEGQLPFSDVVAIEDGVQEYQLLAQIEQEGGDVKCKVTIGDATDEAHAVGGFDVCSARLVRRYGSARWPQQPPAHWARPEARPGAFLHSRWSAANARPSVRPARIVRLSHSARPISSALPELPSSSRRSVRSLSHYAWFEANVCSCVL